MKTHNQATKSLVFILAFLIGSASAYALSATINSTIDFNVFGAFKIKENGDVTATGDTGSLAIGTAANGSYKSGVYLFRMNNFLPDGDYHNYDLTASLSITTDTIEGSPGPVDLVGIRTHTSRNVVGNDFDRAPEVTILSGVTDGNFNVGFDNTAFNTWINDNYVLGDYFYIGLRTQTEPAAGNHVRTLSVATLTVVPETSTYALILGSLVLGFVMLRRRKG